MALYGSTMYLEDVVVGKGEALPSLVEAYGIQSDAGRGRHADRPASASGPEIAGHLALLAGGVGTRGVSFSKEGWTFRLPPTETT
jgi:hypothetical protein